MTDQPVFVDVSPRTRVLQSLRHVGYPIQYAIGDLVDNSLDADANHVKIGIIQHAGSIDIVISDDGFGMSPTDLSEAVRMGSELPSVPGKNGKFGMGLCTASLSLSPCFSVITRHNGGTISGIRHDLKHMSEVNRFEATSMTVEEATTAYTRFAVDPDRYGTIVILEACDQIKHNNIEHLVGVTTERKRGRPMSSENTLPVQLGRMYRRFIDAGREINIVVENDDVTVATVPVVAIDPLEWNEAGTNQWDSGDIEIKGSSARITYRLALIAEDVNQPERVIRQGGANRGFSILRNNREIMTRQRLGMVQEHTWTNRIRGEISFTDELDDQMGINFSKQSIEPTQSVSDSMTEVLKKQIDSLFRLAEQQARANAPVNPEQEEEIKRAEQAINEKASLLETPDTKPGENGKTIDDDADKTPGKTRGARGPYGSRKARKVHFEIVHDGPRANFYEAMQRGSTVLVKINGDHPFYNKYSVDGKLPVSTLTLLYCFAAAEMRSIETEDQVILFDNFITTVSNNLRTLWA